MHISPQKKQESRSIADKPIRVQCFRDRKRRTVYLRTVRLHNMLCCYVMLVARAKQKVRGTDELNDLRPSPVLYT